MKITRQLAMQEVIYSSDIGDYRVRLQRGDNTEVANKWDEWYIERDHEIDPVSEYLNEKDLKFMLQCIKKAKKDFGDNNEIRI